MPFKFLPDSWASNAKAEATVRRNISRTRLKPPSSFDSDGKDESSLATSSASQLDKEINDAHRRMRVTTLASASTRGSRLSRMSESLLGSVASFNRQISITNIKRNYKKLSRQLDDLDWDGWAKLTGELDKPVVIDRLLETSKTPFAPDVRQLSHQIIFKFVMCGFIDLSDAYKSPQELGDFIPEHADFLAETFPAALLLSVMKSKREFVKFEACIKRSWSGSGLPEAINHSFTVVRKYTARFNGVPESIREHARFLTDGLIARNIELSDMSILTGYFPWLYFHMDPNDGGSTWSKPSLMCDVVFRTLIGGVYTTPLARLKAVQHLNTYYSNEKDEKSTMLHLMMYLSAMQQFDVDPTTPPDNVREPMSSPSEDLKHHLSVENFKLQTYYICSCGDTILWAIGNDEQGLSNLIRFIIKNMAVWPEVEENSSLQCGMLRTLYLALRLCGLTNFIQDDGEDEGRNLSSLARHLGSCFRTLPPPDPLEGTADSTDDFTGSALSNDSDLNLAATRIVVHMEIASALESSDNFDYSQRVLDDMSSIERWWLKIRFCTAILKAIIHEGPHSAASDVYRTLSEMESTEGVDNPNQEKSKLLKFLIVQLNISENRKANVLPPTQNMYSDALDWTGFLRKVRPIGGGTFGDVFLAQCVNLPHHLMSQAPFVVVKVMRLHILDADGRDRATVKLNREFKLWGKLRHPNVVPFWGISHQFGEYPSLVAQLMVHGTIRSYLLSHPNVNRRGLVRDVAHGLEYLHGFTPTVIHGDLNCRNILVNHHGVACLGDFGLSHMVCDETLWMTSASVAPGTVRWMAPELLTGTQPTVTLASDVWAFGMSALEISSSILPFAELHNDGAVAIALSQDKLPQKPSGMDEQIWTICCGCWVKEPLARITASKIVAALASTDA